jgi:hypothetical protein
MTRGKKQPCLGEGGRCGRVGGGGGGAVCRVGHCGVAVTQTRQFGLQRILVVDDAASIVILRVYLAITSTIQVTRAATLA